MNRWHGAHTQAKLVSLSWPPWERSLRWWAWEPKWMQVGVRASHRPAARLMHRFRAARQPELDARRGIGWRDEFMGTLRRRVVRRIGSLRSPNAT